VAPITGPMYQLFVFFMVTDPKTTVRPRSGQMVVVFIVAFVEMLLRLAEVVYAPFYALFLVGPASLLIESWLAARVPDRRDPKRDVESSLSKGREKRNAKSDR
jgi:enediyne biosynthesis protein E5